MTVTWVSAPDGMSITYGFIPKIIDAFDPALCCPAGETRLPLGDTAHGSIHLNAPKRRLRFAPLTPEKFVYQITSGYDEVWFQQGRESLLLVLDQRRKAAVLSLALVDGFYGVVTAFPLDRTHNPRKRREIRKWTRL